MTTSTPACAGPALPACRQCAGVGQLLVSQQGSASDCHAFEAQCPVCGGAGVAPEALQQHVEMLRGELDKTRADLMQAGATKIIEGNCEPVAHVPIHPRNGPLWANTVARLDVGDRPQHYPTRPLVFAD